MWHIRLVWWLFPPVVTLVVGLSMTGVYALVQEFRYGPCW